MAPSDPNRSEPIALDAKRRWSGSQRRAWNQIWLGTDQSQVWSNSEWRKGPSRARSPALPGHVVPLLDLLGLLPVQPDFSSPADESAQGQLRRQHSPLCPHLGDVHLRLRLAESLLRSLKT